MLKTVEIQHFKSIEGLSIDCKKVNVFIGEPNTGKSNILEAIGVFSMPFCHKLKDLVRYESMSDLFFDKETDNRISVTGNQCGYEIFYQKGKYNIHLDYGSGLEINYGTQDDGKKWSHPDIDVNHESYRIKFYQYKTTETYKLSDAGFLIPPYGENLLGMLKSNPELQDTAATIFQSQGYKLWLRPHEGKIDIVKDREREENTLEVVVSHPYTLISETFQRLIFYLAAVETNRNAVLIFEEPEVKSFPFYSKFLAESIAGDPNGNQYFLSTHNPYFLLSLLEKSKIEDIAVFITYTENYQTAIKSLTPDEIAEIQEQGIDVFFNILRYIEKE